jgi:DNA-binding response OmpR family regulator
MVSVAIPGPSEDAPLHRLRIYVVEDDPEIRQVITATLRGYEIDAECFRTGGELLRQMKRAPAALCIVDLGLPDMDGMKVVREIQEGYDSGILILTGRSELTDRVLGLELGADDYVTKPFEPRELVARVRSILRRWSRIASDRRAHPGIARFAGWVYDAGANRLTGPEGEAVELSAAEGCLLNAFLRAPNRILSRDQLIGERERLPFDRSIDVRISRLRRKLGDDPQNPRLIKTVYGAGYMLSAAVEWQ